MDVSVPTTADDTVRVAPQPDRYQAGTGSQAGITLLHRSALWSSASSCHLAPSPRRPIACRRSHDCLRRKTKETAGQRGGSGNRPRRRTRSMRGRVHSGSASVIRLSGPLTASSATSDLASALVRPYLRRLDLDQGDEFHRCQQINSAQQRSAEWSGLAALQPQSRLWRTRAMTNDHGCAGTGEQWATHCRLQRQRLIGHSSETF